MGFSAHHHSSAYCCEAFTPLLRHIQRPWISSCSILCNPFQHHASFPTNPFATLCNPFQHHASFPTNPFATLCNDLQHPWSFCPKRLTMAGQHATPFADLLFGRLTFWEFRKPSGDFIPRLDSPAGLALSCVWLVSASVSMPSACLQCAKNRCSSRWASLPADCLAPSAAHHGQAQLMMGIAANLLPCFCPADVP